MGFYYGSSQGPPSEDKPPGFRETLAIIWAVFSVLALPLGIILGMLVAVTALILLFAFNSTAGALAIFAIIIAIVGYGVWEARHPPELR